MDNVKAEKIAKDFASSTYEVLKAGKEAGKSRLEVLQDMAKILSEDENIDNDTTIIIIKAVKEAMEILKY